MFRVCDLTYTHIIHYEHLHHEWHQFLLDTKMKEELELPWRNRRSDEVSYVSYYDLIPEEDMIKLYMKFKDDFLMFGYTI